MEFSSRLIFVRAKLNLNQTKLADILNVSLITINRWENKQSRPSKVAIIRFDEFCKANNINFKEV